jgi:hypothetical protein
LRPSLEKIKELRKEMDEAKKVEEENREKDEAD